MGWKNEDRAKLVRSLRQAAVECGVEAVPDNASREKVREMVRKVLKTKKQKLASARSRAQSDFDKYEATFTDKSAAS